ncbi:thermonuclease family protein [Aureimonas psammosilenae]|uniref:thermonuclease family protein n=1 Tax=Aureimonas psammosilenae TaxID=2495496 RepID=UPI0012605B35|nr:thermonuclease family protein [Aureimonas psammosilenae]
MSGIPFSTLCFALALVAVSPVAHAAEGANDERTVSGPVAARVLKVRDGDTVEVEAFIWPQQVVRTAVRLRGIDAPELKGRCEAEREAAVVARDRLTALLGQNRLELTDISGDKYFGRVLAEVAVPGTPDVSRQLVEEGLVAPYRGDKRRDWCVDGAATALQTPRGGNSG